MSGRLEGRTTVRAILRPCYGELQNQDTSASSDPLSAAIRRAVSLGRRITSRYV